MWKKVRCQVVVAVLALVVPAVGFAQTTKPAGAGRELVPEMLRTLGL